MFRFNQILTALIPCVMMTASLAAFPTPLSTAFTYQGQLKLSGSPLNATADFQFTLFDALFGPNQIGSMVQVNNVSVANGLFTASLDFGATAFDGNDRYLQIAVRSPAGSGSFTTLTPRQPLTVAPYALQTRGIFVDSSNNVGIGTTTPSFPLHIASDLFPVIAIQDTGSSSTQAGYVSYRDGANVETAWVGYGTPGSPHFSMVNARAGGDVQLYSLGAAGNILLHPGPSGGVQIGTGTADYQHMSIGGGNSDGFLYGSFPALGDGIHLGYNYYADAAGAAHIIHAGNGTSRISMGYGSLDFAVGNANTSPSAILHVVATPSSSGVCINTSDPLGFEFYAGGGATAIDTPGNGTMVALRKAGVTEGSISVSGSTVSYNGFTGSHYGWIEGDQSVERGALVSMTGCNHRLHDRYGSDVIYGIHPTSTANDPACLGAYLDVLEPRKPVDADNPHLVMAVGNGDLWVVDSRSGGIQPGDYLISSGIPGCAMKDDPQRFPIGHIVARAAERVNWSETDRDAAGIKRRKISVFFQNFDRESGATSLAVMVREQQSRIASLEARLHETNALAERVARLEAASQFAIKERER